LLIYNLRNVDGHCQNILFHISIVLGLYLFYKHFQTLPDQKHVFYMNDINGCSLEQPAVMVSKIPFTHPTNVAKVLNCHLIRNQWSYCYFTFEYDHPIRTLYLLETTIWLVIISSTMIKFLFESILTIKPGLNEITQNDTKIHRLKTPI
jgi:hypothetical protein